MPNNHTTAPQPATSPTNVLGTSWADSFEANPHLSVAKLVRAMNRNAGIAADVHPELRSAAHAAALDAATAAAVGPVSAPTRTRPRSLPGSILVTRNRTSQRTDQPLSFAPTPADLAALLAGEHLAHDLLTTGMPATLAAQADAIAHFAEPIYREWALRRLERRGVQVAEAAARHYLTHGQPAGLEFAPTGHLLRWYTEQREETATADDAPTLDESAARLVRRARLVWVHPTGPEHGVLLDRFHHAHQRGALERDTWIRSKVAEDLASIDALLRPANASGHHALGVANLGVRVHAHRAPNTGIHFLPETPAGGGRPVPGAHHRLGGCQHCVARTVLPNSGTIVRATSTGPTVTEVPR
jgi:hypothetical protein